MTLSLRQLFIAFIATSSLLLSGCGPDDQSDGQKPSAPLPTAVGRAPSTASKGNSRWKTAAAHRVHQRHHHRHAAGYRRPGRRQRRHQPKSPVADKQGFFTQWSEVAKQRHVERLYQWSPMPKPSPPPHRI